MTEDILKQIWKGGSEKENITIDYHKLHEEMKSKLDHMDQQIKARDNREIGASLVGMAAFAYIGYDIPFFWSKIACGLMIGWFLFVIFRLKYQRRNESPDPATSLNDQLDHRKDYLIGQTNMIKSVLWWYILPPILINALLFFGAGDPDAWDSLFSGMIPDTFIGKIGVMTLVVALNGYIYYLNKKAVKNQLNPLISSIEKTQKDLNTL